VNDLPILKNDARERPEVSVLFKQQVGTEDVYLGMSGSDPTSTKCQALLLKVHLPGQKYKEISLDVNKSAMVIQSTRFYLHFAFPYEVRDKEGRAQWLAEKQELQLTFPIVREELW